MTRPALSLLTPAEVASLLRVEPITVIRACRAGKIRAARPGKTWLITPEAIEQYLAAHSNEGAA